MVRGGIVNLRSVHRRSMLLGGTALKGTGGMIESRFFRRAALVFALVTTTVVLSGQERTATPPGADTTRRPRLVVLLVVDQFAAYYFDLYSTQWTAGLRRLLDDGAVFRNAAYPYANTITCPGHNTIGT